MEYSGIRVLSVLLAAHCKQASKQAELKPAAIDKIQAALKILRSKT